MATVSRIRIKGYRSIRDECTIAFVPKIPLVLIGENNAGKSNVVKALDIVLGEYWPGTRDVDDHEFWAREPQDSAIEIEVFADDLVDERWGPIESLFWACRSDPSREPVFKMFTPDREDRYPNKQVRQQIQAMIVSADRRLSYQLSYTSKRTLLSRLMHRFHESLVKEQDRVERLKKKFAEIVAVFEEVKEFQEFQSGLGEQLGAMLEGMTYGLDVDFSAYDPSNFFHSLRIYPNEDGEIRTFEELGTGQEQVLALVFAHAYGRAFFGGLVLVIEEPEAHLHPLAQEWLARIIRSLAKEGLQIVLTTHSPAFIDVVGLEGVVLLRKTEGATVACQLTAEQLAAFCLGNAADADATDETTILPFYANSATPQILAGLFARKIVLVEGLTESVALPIYLLNAGLDVIKHGIAVIPVMGKGNIAKWWRFFRAYEFPVFVIFDNDSENDKKGAKRSDLLLTLGIAKANVADLLKEKDWVVEDDYSIFGKDFETTLRAAFPRYEALEAEARAELGRESKSLKAKYVAERLKIDGESEGGKKLKKLASRIKKLTV